MLNFQLCLPTNYVFGTDAVDQLPSLLKGYKKVLIHYGGGSIIRSGLLDRVKKLMTGADIRFVELGGVVPNPRLELAQEGIELCRREGVDFVLAVGGGSVIDSAKCISAGVPYDGDVWDFFEPVGTKDPVEILPVGVILTIPAAGSEGSISMVITKQDSIKRPCDVPILRPAFSISDPTLTYTLPAYQTAAGATDIMAHMMERYFTGEKYSDLTDGMIETCLRSTMFNVRRALINPEDYTARAQIMWLSTIAHNDMLGTGRGGNWATHLIEHELSGEFDITHGAGLAIIFPAYIRYSAPAYPDIFVKFATRVFGVQQDFNDPMATVLEGVERLEAFYRSIGMPVRMSECPEITDTSDEMLRKLADNCAVEICGAAIKGLDANDRFEIYKLAR